MYEMPSRREKRESKLIKAAEKGLFSIKDILLYKSEADSLRRKGFDVVRYGESKENSKRQLPSVISWNEAFYRGIPLICHEYISGLIDTFPEKDIENWAQELYVTAARAINMVQTN